MKTVRLYAAIVSVLLIASAAQAQLPSSAGDCDGDGEVEVYELIFGIRISLDLESIDDCPSFDVDGDGAVTIGELITAVIAALDGYPVEPLACGGPLDVECRQGEFCEFPEGTCDDPEVIGTCTKIPVGGCLDILMPVCGCNGTTYGNDCVRQEAGVSKAMDGDCPQFVVTKTEDTADGACDDADCSLREAIIAANEILVPAEVIVPSGTYALTLEGDDEDAAATGDLDITGNLTLAGFGAVIDGNGTDRVFDIHSDATARISEVTIQNGSAGGGGGIANGGTLTLTDSTVRDNSASLEGCGIFNRGEGTLTVNNSTVSGNARRQFDGTTHGFSPPRGGGIFTEGRTLTVRNTTVSGNLAGIGGGILAFRGHVILTNSVIANNSFGDCLGFGPDITSGGHNLIGLDRVDGSEFGCGLTGPGDLSEVDAHLAPLGNYGGPTDTHALCTGPGEPHPDCTDASPALDAGDNAACPDTDQRGVERPQPIGGGCDIGAYEAE